MTRKVILLSERVSVEALDRVASSTAATWTPPGSAIPLRTVLFDIRQCIEGGRITSVWREEDEKKQGRRHSGIGEAPALREMPARLRGLIAAGVNHHTVGMSLFSLPGYIRNLLRSGIETSTSSTW